MASSKPSITKEVVLAFFILLAVVPFQANAFIILAPIILNKMNSDSGSASASTSISTSDKAMNASDTLKLLVRNTAVVELAEGTGYAFFKADGRAVGMHPAHGRLEGNWNVDSTGKTCITWVYPSGSITNCDNVADLANGIYQWGNRAFSMSKGDVKDLDKM